MNTDLRYPIGDYEPQPFSEELKAEWIAAIRFLPSAVEAALSNLDEAQLETPYRDGGWSLKQVVHHLADSHSNALIRFKLGLTEENPTIKPYNEKRWAELADNDLPVNISITLLHALHHRWVSLLESVSNAEWERTVVHPEHNKTLSLWWLLGSYAWHGRHHTAHITSLRERRNWN